MRSIGRAVIFSGMVVSCSAGTSGSSHTPERREGQRVPTATSKESVEPTQPAASVGSTSATPTDTSVVGTPPAAPGAPACSGADLDVDAILASKACRVNERAQPPWPPNELGLEISDKAVLVRSGDSTTITVAIVNRTTQERTLDIDNCGGKQAGWATEVVDGRGKRVDYITTESPMRPGRFTLRVMTPFRDPDPTRGPAAVKSRFAAAPLDVKQ